LSDELSLILAPTVAFAATYALTPLAIGIAERTDSFDHPRGYKAHANPTPYLGGIAVLGGFTIAVLAAAQGLGRLWPILVGAIALCVAGILDDRHTVGPGTRLLVEVVAALGLFAAGLGWEYLPTDGANLVLTILFVVGVVNAFNLMDNQDGAAGTVAMVTVAGTFVLALIEGSVARAALCLALAGACGGFLPYNLAGPARIFLGNGGSTPLGFIVAAAIMSVEGGAEIGWVMVLVTVVLVGLPALDTALVIVSRLRRGARVYHGGRDHLTHRLLVKLGSVRRVALALGVAQAALWAVGVGLYQADQGLALAGASACIVLGLAAVALLETSRWAPPLTAAADHEGAPRDFGLRDGGAREALTEPEVVLESSRPAAGLPKRST
jgi:UDP-GlcNAc:undecaprenyl-phosphate GlcNAc-1-phosphate transferase